LGSGVNIDFRKPEGPEPRRYDRIPQAELPRQNDRPIFICRNLRQPLDRIWDRLKRYR
jgi:hypothetical protein